MKWFSMLKMLLLTYLFSGLLLLLLSLGLYKLGLTEGQVRVGILAVYFLSCTFGGFFMGKAAGSRKFLWGMLLSTAYFAVLTAISFVVNRSLSGGGLHMFAEFGLCLAGGALGGILA